MNGVLAVSALAVFAAVCGALIKKGNPEIALLFSIGAAVLVFLYVLPQTESLAETIGMLAEASEMSEALQVLLKALGIVLVGRIAAGICRDAGESALASGVEFAVKVAVLLTALPLLQSLLAIVQEVLTL